MQMHKPWLLRSPPSTILRLILPLVIIISSPPSPVFFSGADQYSDCAPQEYSCGSLRINLSYPFYNNSGGLDYCGYPGFNLTCTGDILTIDINKSPFVVKDINSSENLLAVVQPEIFNDNCNHVSLDNVTLDTTRFDYYPDYNDEVILFISCTTTFSTMNAIGGCIENSYYWTYQSGSSPPNWSSLESSCRVVETWVNRTALRLLEEAPSSVTFWNLLQDGFALKWTAGKELCGDCTKSSGRCGFNFTTNNELCFCEDGSAGERPCNQDFSSFSRVELTFFTRIQLQILINESSHWSSAILSIVIDWLVILIPFSSLFTCTRCRETDKSNKGVGRKIGIAIGAVVASLLGGLLFLLYKRTKKRNRPLPQPILVTRSSSSGVPSSKSKFSKNDSELSISRYRTHVFTYEELEDATDGFSSSRELGDGGFGTVYKGTLGDGRVIAVKRLYENNFKRVEQFMNEVDILSGLHHPNLVILYGCTSRHSRELLLVYEYVPNGTVADHLHGPRATEQGLPLSIRLSIAIETADALRYLHGVEPQIIHRDVKTNNILLDNNFHVKVADFGLSRLFPINATHVSTAPQGTPGYVDPEYHMCYQLTDKSDVYSFGVVLAELISSLPAVDISRHRSEINLANMLLGKLQNNDLRQIVDPRLGYQTDMQVKKMIDMVVELAFRCLQAEKDMRPSIKQVLDALRDIESVGFGTKESSGGDEVVKQEACLLKNQPPYSPPSVMERWASVGTTPSNSG